MTEADDELALAVTAFATRPRVLVAVDFDGTLAPFVVDPLKAQAVPGGLEALRAAAALDDVTVAVVSGRDLATLATLTGIGPDDGVVLIGSHGAEGGCEPEDKEAVLDEATAARLSLVQDALDSIRARYPAARLERKPGAVALHTRGVEPSVAAAATTAACQVGEHNPGVHVLRGKDVVELSVREANKGSALVDLARATQSEATLYVGDDVTDELAFSALDPATGDLTVKVGNGQTAAAHRVPDPERVVKLLELFVDRRRVLG